MRARDAKSSYSTSFMVHPRQRGDGSFSAPRRGHRPADFPLPSGKSAGRPRPARFGGVLIPHGRAADDPFVKTRSQG